MQRAARGIGYVAIGILGAFLSLQAAAQGAKPLGTNDHEVSGVEVTLLELKRASGDTVTAKWRYSNKDRDTKQLTKGTGGDDPYKLSIESYLVDPVNKKKYLILKDSTGKPIAAAHGGSYHPITLEGGKSINTWAKYPAPPAGVEKVSVYIQGVAPFEDVPLSK
jgi:hypothetical protein